MRLCLLKRQGLAWKTVGAVNRPTRQLGQKTLLSLQKTAPGGRHPPLRDGRLGTFLAEKRPSAMAFHTGSPSAFRFR